MRFSPSILATLLTVFFVGLFIALGNWQLMRADAAQMMMAQLEKSKLIDPVALPPADTVMAAPDEWRYREINTIVEW